MNKRLTVGFCDTQHFPELQCSSCCRLRPVCFKPSLSLCVRSQQQGSSSSWLTRNSLRTRSQNPSDGSHVTGQQRTRCSLPQLRVRFTHSHVNVEWFNTEALCKVLGSGSARVILQDQPRRYSLFLSRLLCGVFLEADFPGKQLYILIQWDCGRRRPVVLFPFSCRLECPRHVAARGVISGANDAGLACLGWFQDEDAREVYKDTFFFSLFLV